MVRVSLPREGKAELLRFGALIPLAQMDFRTPMSSVVTASDASSLGGGICASTGLTSFGVAAQAGSVRGELAEPQVDIQVLTVGLFDGIAALRVAVDLLRVPLAGHVSVEFNPQANRVVAFRGSILVPSMRDVQMEAVMGWACQFSLVGLLLVGAGPPCQDVSTLNVDRKCSQVVRLLKKCFPRAQVHMFMESVASMDAEDRAAMSEDVGVIPCRVDAAGVSLARRLRLYWCTWELKDGDGFVMEAAALDGWAKVQQITLTAALDPKDFLEPRWFLPPGHKLATFTIPPGHHRFWSYVAALATGLPCIGTLLTSTSLSSVRTTVIKR